ncbi:MAG: GTP-binding protein [Promethearchaeota archaeon]
MVEGRSFSFRIAVIGDSTVGKSSIMEKFTKSGLKSRSFGANFVSFEKKIGGDRIRLGFFDITGPYYLNPSRRFLFGHKQAAIIVCSLEDTEQGEASILHVPDWHAEILKYSGDIPLYLFANKVDLVDNVELFDARMKTLVEEYNFKDYYYTSVQAGQNVIKAFNDIIMELYNKFKDLPPEPTYSPRVIKEKKNWRKKKRFRYTQS